MTPHPYRIGSLVGAVGATVFVLANRGQLAEPWSWLALIGYGAALAFYLWAVWLRPAEALPVAEPPRRHAGLVYLASVAGMLLLFWVGRQVLAGAGREDLMPALIVLGVGLHLVPFASAFRAPVFLVLGWVMALIGAVALVAGWLGGPDGDVVPLAAVNTGIVMLVLIGVGALVRPAADGRSPQR